MVRAAYGATLVLLPGPAIRLATGRIPSRRTCRVARALGARHLVQATLTAVAPAPGALALGGQVDAAHTASMLLVAAVSRAGRRAALTDALTEAAFATAGFSVRDRATIEAAACRTEQTSAPAPAGGRVGCARPPGGPTWKGVGESTVHLDV
jgi:hypothetical protein